MALLAQKAAWSAEMDDYNTDPGRTDSDEEEDSDSPISDSFYLARGSETIFEMTIFNERQLQIIGNNFAASINSFYIVDRGIQIKYTGNISCSWWYLWSEMAVSRTFWVVFLESRYRGLGELWNLL